MVIKNTKKVINSKATAEEMSQNEARVIAQELQIVRALACNDLNKRNKQVKKLRKWLTLRSKSSFPFTEEDFVRLWKGLYYNMWMSDKPLVQEELAENISQLIDCFGNVCLSIRFFAAFLRIMSIEWFGMDQWRMDKFLMLIRRMLRNMFRVLKSATWEEVSIDEFNKYFHQTVLDQNTPIGLIMHLLDIFFEELAKVSEGNINSQQVSLFVKPFLRFLSCQKNPQLISHCRTRVFYQLLYQSTLGREYMEKYNAWRLMGFPTKSIDDLEKVESDSAAVENEQMETIEGGTFLDPRAGDVDVFMPELPLDGKYVIDEINLLLKKESYTKCRKMLRKLLTLFETYQNGTFPLGVKTMPRFEQKSEKPLIKQKVEQLENLENQMFSTVRKLKQLNKRKRRKLLKSIDYTDLDESNFEQIIEDAIPKQCLNSRMKEFSVISTKGSNEWIEEELDTEPLKKIAKKEANPSSKLKNKKVKLSTKGINVPVAKCPTGSSKKTDNLTQETTQNDMQVNDVEKKRNMEEQSKDANTKTENINVEHHVNEWDKPLAEGEIEYFVPSRKQHLRSQSTDFKHSSNAKINKQNETIENKTSASSNISKTPVNRKRVKIQLKNNTIQKPSEYIKQIISSPDLPFDANKKPGKGLLKPNSVPSPINPFYKKKIGLNLFNETF